MPEIRIKGEELEILEKPEKEEVRRIDGDPETYYFFICFYTSPALYLRICTHGAVCTARLDIGLVASDYPGGTVP